MSILGQESHVGCHAVQWGTNLLYLMDKEKEKYKNLPLIYQRKNSKKINCISVHETFVIESVCAELRAVYFDEKKVILKMPSI